MMVRYGTVCVVRYGSLWWAALVEDTCRMYLTFGILCQGLLTMKHAHYFDLYHRHLQHFRGKKSHLLEIGVASGGSLQMWKA